MHRDSRATRRRFVQIGAGGALGGLAGCVGSGDSRDEAAGRDADSATPTATERDDHSVTMAPMGEVAFESVPEAWTAYFSTYGDMGIALGQLDGLRGSSSRRTGRWRSTSTSPASRCPSTTSPS